MRDLTEHDEPGVALENLCSNLGDFDVIVPAEIYDTLVRLGSHMRIDAKYWTTLSRTLAEMLGQFRWPDAARARRGRILEVKPAIPAASSRCWCT